MFEIKREFDYSKSIYDTDSYKCLHKIQYPVGIKKSFSYLEARGSEIEGVDEIVVFGLQYHIAELMKTITKEDIEEAKPMFNNHIQAFSLEDDWSYIVEKHEGKLPVIIRSVPEGTVVPVGNVIATIENTDDRLFWLPNYIETKLMRVWKPITVATISREYKKIIKAHMEKTCDNLNGLPFMVHDFSSRSASSYEDSFVGSMAHLTSFLGTDTTSVLFNLKKYYNCDIAGYSVYATEHSVVTSYGKDNESFAYSEIYKRTIGQICSVVSDSYDIENAILNIWGEELLPMVENGDKTVVIRLDCGDTVEIVRTALNLMQKRFSHYINTKGYKIFNKVKILQGDGVNFKTMKAILEVLDELKFATDVIVFGIGSELCHKFNRDTFKFAIKMCANTFDNIVWNDVYKDPKGSFKKSKKGLLGLYMENGKMITKATDYATMDSKENLLQPIFKNGEFLSMSTLDDIRNRLGGV